MPDEQSNLNLPAAARRPAGRRRGRRGGRGRSPRPAVAKAPTVPTEEIPPAFPEPEMTGETVGHGEIAEPERDTSGDFREPHPEEHHEEHGEHIEETAETTAAEAEPVAEMAASAEAAPEPEAVRPPPAQPREFPPRDRRPEQRRPEPQRPKPWVKPADFRPAETSAIHQAVAHATEIAESLKHTIDQLDEILELVELAERQKIADEREIEELRRALRRIQPPRHQSPPSRGPRHDEPHRGYKDQAPRRDEPRHARPESPENIQRHEEPPPARAD